MCSLGEFEAFIADQNGCAVVKVRGDVDMAVADALLAVVREAIAASPHVVFDMTGVTFLDSSGLRVLVATALEVREGGSVTIRNTPANVSRVIELAGLTETFILESTDRVAMR